MRFIVSHSTLFQKGCRIKITLVMLVLLTCINFSAYAADINLALSSNGGVASGSGNENPDYGYNSFNDGDISNGHGPRVHGNGNILYGVIRFDNSALGQDDVGSHSEYGPTHHLKFWVQTQTGFSADGWGEMWYHTEKDGWVSIGTWNQDDLGQWSIWIDDVVMPGPLGDCDGLMVALHPTATGSMYILEMEAWGEESPPIGYASIY